MDIITQQPVNIDGVDLNIIFESVKDILTGGFSTYLFQRNGESTVDGGTIIITIPNHAAAGINWSIAGAIQNQIPSGTQIQYNISNRKQQGYTLFDFDYKSGQAKIAIETANKYIDSLAYVLELQLLALYCAMIKESCLAKAGTGQIALPYDITDLSKTNATQANAEETADVIYTAYADLVSQISASVIGTKWEDYLMIINLKGQRFLNKALTWSVSDKAYTELGLEGGKELRVNNGIVYAIDNFVVGRDLSTENTLFDATDTDTARFDFSQVLGYVIHKNAAEFRYNMWQSAPVPKDNGSLYIPIQYVCGGLVYRPELAKILTYTAPSN